MSGRIPPPNIPLAMQDGTISPDWYRYFVSLARTADAAGAGEVVGGDGLDGGGAIADGVTISIADNGVSDAMLREGLATSVIGRFLGSDGDVADIQATADNRVLARQGGILVFTGGPQIDALTVKARAVTSSTIAAASDYFIAANATGGAITVTLPSLSAGRLFTVKKTDASANNVTLSGAANIDGAASAAITTQYAAIALIGGATEWHII